MNNASRLLELQRQAERSFTDRELRAKREPVGWPASLIMFHVAQWRERLATGLASFKAGLPYTPPPPDIDELNDAELPRGAGLTLRETGKRSEELLVQLIHLSEEIGDRPFVWRMTRTSSEAIIRNSYLHPRIHIAAYYQENGDQAAAHEIAEQTVSDLRAEAGPPVVMGAALYNLAGVRVAQQKQDEALELLEQGLGMRPDLRGAAVGDPDLAPLNDDPRFIALTSA